MKIFAIVILSALVSINFAFAQSQIITTGNNVVNTAVPTAADIVIGSYANGGIRHDASMMWWSNASASRISNTADVFYMSVWSSSSPNIALSATLGGSSYFLGNLGIGTTTPTDKLVVNGNIKTILENSFPSKNMSGIISLGYSGITGAKNWALRGVYQYWNGVGQNADGGDLDLIKAQDGNTVLATKFDGTILGSVLIGKTTPSASNYMLDVNGNVRSNSIVINTTGADFVFEPNYALPSLTDIKTYIEKNHHLPEIPSAKEMQTNGLNVGDNQTKLLQKIEELTLYLIEKDKKEKEQDNLNKEYKQKIEAQQTQIDELNKKLEKLISKN